MTHCVVGVAIFELPCSDSDVANQEEIDGKMGRYGEEDVGVEVEVGKDIK